MRVSESKRKLAFILPSMSRLFNTLLHKRRIVHKTRLAVWQLQGNFAEKWLPCHMNADVIEDWKYDGKSWASESESTETWKTVGSGKGTTARTDYKASEQWQLGISHHTELAQNEVCPVDAKGKLSTSSRSPFRPPPVPSALMENPSCHSAMGGLSIVV